MDHEMTMMQNRSTRNPQNRLNIDGFGIAIDIGG